MQSEEDILPLSSVNSESTSTSSSNSEEPKALNVSELIFQEEKKLYHLSSSESDNEDEANRKETDDFVELSTVQPVENAGEKVMKDTGLRIELDLDTILNEGNAPIIASTPYERATSPQKRTRVHLLASSSASSSDTSDADNLDEDVAQAKRMFTRKPSDKKRMKDILTNPKGFLRLPEDLQDDITATLTAVNQDLIDVIATLNANLKNMNHVA